MGGVLSDEVPPPPIHGQTYQTQTRVVTGRFSASKKTLIWGQADVNIRHDMLRDASCLGLIGLPCLAVYQASREQRAELVWKDASTKGDDDFWEKRRDGTMGSR